MKKNGRIKASGAYLVGAILVSIGMSGCTSRSLPDVAKIEGSSLMKKRNVSEAEFKTNSLIQNLQREGEREGFRTIFSPGTKDVLVSNTNKSWSGLVLSAQNQRGVSVRGDMFSSGTKNINIQKNTRTVYTDMLSFFTRPNVIQGEKYHGKYILDYDRYTKSLVNATYFHKSEPIRLKRFMNKLYGVAKDEGKNIYFGLNAKGNILYVRSSPIYIKLSPLKRQRWVNYLNTAGIRYVGDSTRVAVTDTFDNWVKAMNEVSTYNKYRHQVYRVKDRGGKYYDVADGSFQGVPLKIEQVSWNKDGSRTYYIQDKVSSQKVRTSSRTHTYRGYTISFY